MIQQLFESAALWLIFVTALFAYLGVLAASRTGLPLVVGALAGAVTWFFGVAVLLIVGGVRGSRPRRSRSGRGRTDDTFGAASTYGAPTSWSTASDPFGAPAYATSQSFTGRGGDRSDDPFALPSSSFTPYFQPSTAMFEPAGRTRAPRADVAQAAALVVCGVVLLLSAFVPWADGSVAWSHGKSHFGVGISPSEATPVAVALVLSALAVIGTAGLAWRYPRGTWLAVAFIAATWWFWLITEWLLFKGDVAGVTSTISGVTGTEGTGQISVEYGTWLAYVSSLGVIAVVLAATVRLIRHRARTAGGGQS